MSRTKTEERKARKTKKKGLKEQQFNKKPIWLLLALVLTLVSYSGIYDNQYVNYDDDVYVTENPPLRNLEIGTLFSEIYLNQYAPLAMTIAGLEFKASDANLGFIRFMSVFFHLLCVLLVFGIFRIIMRDDFMAAMLALLFGLHPMQVESVAWLAASMKIGTYSFFFLLATWTYLRYRITEKKSFLVWTFLAFLASCFCKEQAVVLPLVLVLIDYLRGKDIFKMKVWVEKIPFFVVSVIFGLVTLKASQGSELVQKVYDFGFGERLLFAMYSAGMYVVRTIAPLDLSFFYTYPVKGEIPAQYYIVPLLVLGLIYLMIRAFKKDQRWLAFGIAFFLVNIFLTTLTAVMAVRDVLMADRYVYIPIIGLFFILVQVVHTRKEGSSSSLKYIFLVLGIVYAGLTFSRVEVFKDSVSLFSDVIEKGTSPGEINPYLALAYNNRGIALKRSGQIDKAQADYAMAIKSNPGYTNAFLNRGNIFFDAGNDDLALADYNVVLDATENAKAYSARGAIFAKRKQYDSAIEDMNKAVKLDGYFTDAYSNRALTYLEMGRFDEAIADCSSILKMTPNRADMYELRAYIKARKGDHQAAIIDFDRSIQLDGGRAAFYFNRGLSYRALENKTLALKDFQRASSMGYTVPADILNTVQN